MIRSARLTDIDALVPLSVEGIKESELGSYFVIDQESIIESLILNIQADQIGFFVSEDGGKLKGFIIVVIAPFYGNKEENTAIESHWFVPLQFRKESHGLKLLQYAMDWSVDQGAKVFIISHPETNQRLRQLYERKGFKPLQSTYIKGRG